MGIGRGTKNRHRLGQAQRYSAEMFGRDDRSLDAMDLLFE